MVIKPSDQQHWISIKEITGGFLLMDSKKSQPKYLNTDEMGLIVRENCETPGAVHFVFKTSKEIVVDKTRMEEDTLKGTMGTNLEKEVTDTMEEGVWKGTMAGGSGTQDSEDVIGGTSG
ncbi:uncharacterized protein LOC134249315 [Saccostrea cucullata]|uniref:uncharacterized protein LOC134249315 n=1 Tax=Saccostrea cuccullata TaxID=36930 RepID=UPI002ED41058